MEGLKEFLTVSYGSGDGDGDGSGSGDGYGDGDGSGYGSGDGSGDGDGDGSGYGSGDGYGYGDGYGDGSGSGYGSGDDYGYGDGYGSGDGYGDGLKSYSNNPIHYIDEIQTVIEQLKGNIAKGFIINKDLTTRLIYIAKAGNSFAHGETAKKALRDAEKKHLNNSPVEEKIESFYNKFDGLDKIPAKDLFDWHFVLTGSCETGRDMFVRERDIDLNNDAFTVQEFVDLTKDSYGGEIVKQLIAN